MQPAFFSDLNLDQVVEAITAGREEHDLAPFFYARLNSVASIEYRQAVFEDLKIFATAAHVRAFGQHMRGIREQFATRAEVYYELQKQRWFLEAVKTYSIGVRFLARDLGLAAIKASPVGTAPAPCQFLPLVVAAGTDPCKH